MDKFLRANGMKAIFDAIASYHKQLGYPPVNYGFDQQRACHRDLCLALHREVDELLEAVPWKPWRPDNYKQTDLTNLAEEVIDTLFFLGSILELWKIDPAAISTMFEEKLAENKRRILSGYNKPSGEM